MGLRQNSRQVFAYTAKKMDPKLYRQTARTQFSGNICKNKAPIHRIYMQNHDWVGGKENSGPTIAEPALILAISGE
jgi:hypothetical protein